MNSINEVCKLKAVFFCVKASALQIPISSFTFNSVDPLANVTVRVLNVNVFFDNLLKTFLWVAPRARIKWELCAGIRSLGKHSGIFCEFHEKWAWATVFKLIYEGRSGGFECVIKMIQNIDEDFKEDILKFLHYMTLYCKALPKSSSSTSLKQLKHF